MRRAGVICEFNPFHNGHKFLLEKIKAEYADEIVCVMSGNFVQRGDIAITEKFSRTTAALQNGADLVAELPTAYAVSSASIFAENGVRLAAALNCDMLIFGAESSINELTELSELLDHRPVNDMIRNAMQKGEYFPKALSIAVGEDFAGVIKQPNNILALEYLRACRKYGIKPIAVKRKDAVHDDTTIYDTIASAGMIRSMICDNADYRPYTPMTIADPCTISKIEPAILYRLKTITPDELRQIAEVGEGLENRIIETAKQYNSLSEILSAVKTKRYTMARLRRIISAAFLGISAETQNTPVPYLRILGLCKGQESILKDAKLPLVIKTRSDYNRLDISAKEIFNIDLRAAEAMNIARSHNPINEFSQGIIKYDR